MSRLSKCRRCYEYIVGTVYSVDTQGPYCYNCQRSLTSAMADAHEYAYETPAQAFRDGFYPLDVPQGKVKSDGGSTKYYELPEHATELRHLISYKGMSKSRGDIFKACYRLGEKDGADLLYDLNKIKFFAEDLIEMYERGERV